MSETAKTSPKFLNDHGADNTFNVTIGGDFNTFNSSSTAAQSPVDYPSDIIADSPTTTNASNVTTGDASFVPTNASFLELWHQYEQGQTPGTDPVVRVYGVTAGSDTWFACPVYPIATAPTFEGTLDDSNGTVRDGTNRRAGGLMFWLKGARRIIVVVSTAGAVTNGGTVVGRYVT